MSFMADEGSRLRMSFRITLAVSSVIAELELWRSLILLERRNEACCFFVPATLDASCAALSFVLFHCDMSRSHPYMFSSGVHSGSGQPTNLQRYSL